MYSTVTSCAMVGADPTPVTIETTILGGRGNFIIVGLPDTAVREARERVKSAMRQQGFSFPGGRVVCNLSPAGIPKAGVTYDLPIATQHLSWLVTPRASSGAGYIVRRCNPKGSSWAIRKTALDRPSVVTRQPSR